MDHSGWTERALEMKAKLAAHEATADTDQEFADAEGTSVSAELTTGTF